MDVTSVALGAAGVLGLYFLYLVLTKGGSAALAFIKSKLGSVEAAIVADVQKDIAAIKADITAIKAKVGL